MKKLLLLTIVLTLLTACSSDDSPATTPTETAVRLKKVTSTDEDGKTITSNYNYNGTKLTSVITNDGSSNIYTYTGDINTGMERYENYTLRYIYTYKYDENNKLFSKTVVVQNSFPKFGQKDLYTYNENGTTTIKSYQGNPESEMDLIETTTVSYPNTSTIQYESEAGTKVVYTYDGKNHPLKDILETDIYSQNLLTVINITPVEPITYFDNTYTYNSNNYPVTSTEKVYTMGVYKTFKKQFFYE